MGEGRFFHQLFIQIHRVFGHPPGMIALVNGLLGAAAAVGGELGLQDHPFQGRRQRRDIARREEQTAAGVRDHFGKGPVGGQHGRHAVGPGLEDRQPLALAADAGHADHVERLQEGDLARAVQLAQVFEALAQARRPGRLESRSSRYGRSAGSRYPAARSRSGGNSASSASSFQASTSRCSPLSGQIRERIADRQAAA